MVARKGQPNLVNDPGYRPDWRERVRERGPDERLKMMTFRSSGAFVAILSKAARRRGMSNSAYARRAIAAFIASDLEMPFEDVCATFPGVVHRSLSKDGVVWPRDDGKGYGNWDVKG